MQFLAISRNDEAFLTNRSAEHTRGEAKAWPGGDRPGPIGLNHWDSMDNWSARRSGSSCARATLNRRSAHARTAFKVCGGAPEIPPARTRGLRGALRDAGTVGGLRRALARGRRRAGVRGRRARLRAGQQRAVWQLHAAPRATLHCAPLLRMYEALQLHARIRASDNETVILYALLAKAGRAGAGGRSAGWS